MNCRTDAELVAILDAELADPGYKPVIRRPSEIARAHGVTRQVVTNWAARTDRTRIRRYPGGLDCKEVVRWLLIRDEDRATRRTGKLDA